MSDRLPLFSSWLFTHIPTLEIINDEWLLSLRPDPVFLLLLGGAGTGKSTLVTTWLDQYHPPSPSHPLMINIFGDTRSEPEPFLLTCINRETPTQCAKRLIKELGSESYARSAHDLWLEVGEVLRSRRIPLLIFDQAERLSLTLCQSIQDYLYEHTSCSLLFVATPNILPTLSQDPSLYHRIQSCTITQFDTPL